MNAFFECIGSIFGYILYGILFVCKNYGIAIILFSLIVKLITTPLLIHQKQTSQKTEFLQKRQEEIRSKYKDSDNKDELNKELTEMYAKNKYNPVLGCISPFLMFFLLIGIFFAVISPLTSTLHLNTTKVETAIEQVDDSYRYKQLGVVDEVVNDKQNYSNVFEEQELKKISDFGNSFNFIGINLFDVPLKSFSVTLIFPILCAIFPLISLIKGSADKKKKDQQNKSEGVSNNSAKQITNGEKMHSVFKWIPLSMGIFSILLSVFIAFTVPCAVSLYWISSSLFSIFQNIFVKKYCEKVNKFKSSMS